MTTNCTDCGATLTTDRTWRKLTTEQRRQLRANNTQPHHSRGLCRNCYKHTPRTPTTTRIIGRCTDCDAILVSAHLWKTYTPSQRETHRASGHAVHGSGGYCGACAKARERGRPRNVTTPPAAAPTEADAFTGQWRRRGLIWLPTSTTTQHRLNPHPTPTQEEDTAA